jgi:YD repeat-containing protein
MRDPAALAEVLALADGWEEEAGRRRRLTPSAPDPVADAIVALAAQLRARVQAVIDGGGGYVSVETWAKIEEVTPATARSWIRAGELQAIRDAAGRYRVRRDARRRIGSRLVADLVDDTPRPAEG